MKQINTNYTSLKKTKLRPLSRAGLILFLFLAFFSLLFYDSNPYILFASVGFFSAAIVLIPPAIQKGYDVFSTWSLASLSIILGSTVRGLYLSAEYPDYETLNFLFFLDNPAEYFIYPSILLLICLLLMAMGFLLGPVKKRKFNSNSTFYNVNARRLYIFAFMAFFISLVSIFLYVQFTGGLDINNLSKKRTLIDSVKLSRDHHTWQSLRTIASISMLAHLLVLAEALQTKNSKKTLKLIFSGALFLTAIFIPFYASSRGIVLMYGIFSLAVVYYIKRTFAWKRVFLMLGAGVFLFQMMSVLRTADDLSLEKAASDTSFNFAILDRLVVNRNDLEVAKTAHIMNSIPDTLEYQHGKTIAVWLVAPIPREFWNTKPLISSGPIIGTKIYGNRISGVPPGFVGEMYWNFSIFGVIIGGFLLGWLMKWVHIRFNPKSSGSLARMVLYVYGPMQIGYLIIGTSVGFGLVTAGVNTLIAYVTLRFIKVL